MIAGRLPGSDRPQQWRPRGAVMGGVRAAGSKRATWGRPQRAGEVAFERLESMPLEWIDGGHGVEEGAGVGMLAVVEDFRHRAALYDAAEVDDQYPIHDDSTVGRLCEISR